MRKKKGKKKVFTVYIVSQYTNTYISQNKTTSDVNTTTTTKIVQKNTMLLEGTDALTKAKQEQQTVKPLTFKGKKKKKKNSNRKTMTTRTKVKGDGDVGIDPSKG